MSGSFRHPDKRSQPATTGRASATLPPGHRKLSLMNSISSIEEAGLPRATR
jgi:hypothetical protein